MLFECRLASTALPEVFLAVRLAGGIDAVHFKHGRLSARVNLYYFDVHGSSLGDLSKALIEDAVRAHMASISDAIPPIEIPVRLEDGVTIKGLGEGAVSV